MLAVGCFRGGGWGLNVINSDIVSPSNLDIDIEIDIDTDRDRNINIDRYRYRYRYRYRDGEIITWESLEIILSKGFVDTNVLFGKTQKVTGVSSYRIALYSGKLLVGGHYVCLEGVDSSNYNK